MIRILVCTLLCVSCLTGCGFVKKLFGSSPEVVSIDRGVRLAGRVQSVDEEGAYVLIRRYGPWRFDVAEEIAESRGANRTANLLPTGEKLGEHIAADIRSGDVKVGDAVYIRIIKSPQGPKPATEPQEPEKLDLQPKLGENL